MSTQYIGGPNNVVAPAAVNIASSTNANPIVVTTSTPHKLLSKTYVDIQGHQTNTRANGMWPVTVLSPTTFSIPLSGNGVGGATGTVQSLALGTSTAIPSDGDDEAAASVDTPLETVLDQTAFLAQATGFYKLASLTYFTSTGAIAWGTFTAADTNVHVLTPVNGGYVEPFPVPGVSGGDIVEMELQTSFTQVTNPATAMFVADVTVPGGTPTPANVTGCGAAMPVTGSSLSTAEPLFVKGVLTATRSGTLNVWPAIQCLAGSGVSSFVGTYTVVIRVWRATGMLQ